MSVFIPHTSYSSRKRPIYTGLPSLDTRNQLRYHSFHTNLFCLSLTLDRYAAIVQVSISDTSRVLRCLILFTLERADYNDKNILCQCRKFWDEDSVGNISHRVWVSPSALEMKEGGRLTCGERAEENGKAACASLRLPTRGSI